MEIDIGKVKRVFFVGIGGSGISALARMMLQDGKEVYGSNISESETTRALAKEGAEVTIGQGFGLIPSGTDLIVYTIAIQHYDPALMDKIHACGIPAKSYPEMLHVVTGGKYTIAVSGTHGKTTVTAMIAQVLIETNKDPSVIVGSPLKEYKSNLILGKSEYFVVEACEYERSFLNIQPKILVITNIEADHLDYYKDLADIESAFSEMAAQTADAIVCDPGDPSVARVLADKNIRVVDYTKYHDSVPPLLVPGEHNRKDAACALAVADILGIEQSQAQNALAHFQGTGRRLEKKREMESGAVIYDDYAHHPTEVRASLEALREVYPKGEKKIVVLFQPHLYSRTKALFGDFASAFGDADSVYFLPIFYAREEPDPSISSELLAECIPGARAFSSFEEAERFFKENPLKKDTVFVTMGAGEAYKVAEAL